MSKKMTGNEALSKVLDELLALSPEELEKVIESHHSKEEKHWAVEAMEYAGCFEEMSKKK